MTQEKLLLLLQDLCARLPYGVICQVNDGAAGLNNGKLVEIDASKRLARFDADFHWDAWIDDIRPYLRPMTSMTEEERKEYEGFIIHRDHINAQGQEWDIDCLSFGSVPRLLDWLCIHHFDYKGLIPMGLALEAPDGMYKI